jgi:hypothetical protein
MRRSVVTFGSLCLAGIFILSTVADADAARRWRRYYFVKKKPMPPPVLIEPRTERAQFPLPEGVVRIEFPTSLSNASYNDMQAWLDLVMRRAKRTVTDEKPPTSAATAQ